MSTMISSNTLPFFYLYELPACPAQSVQKWIPQTYLENVYRHGIEEFMSHDDSEHISR